MAVSAIEAVNALVLLFWSIGIPFHLTKNTFQVNIGAPKLST